VADDGEHFNRALRRRHHCDASGIRGAGSAGHPGGRENSGGAPE
jgi:hypothetical protein